jgi:hydrogenase nickel incorporation protein HypA/HybF
MPQVHELSICQALLAQVAKIATDHGSSEVAGIIVEIGPLAGVEPVLLERAFAFAREGSCAAAAVLSIETTGVIVSCLSCGAQSRTAPNRLLCSACGGYRTRIVAGDELRLRRVELRAPSVRSTSVAA